MRQLIAQASWRPVDDYGLEHLHLTKTANGNHRVDSFLVREIDGHVFSAVYVIHCNPDGTFRALELKVITDEVRTLFLSIDEHGVWRNETDEALPDLSGCHEIDISVTPFTNTLAIQRLNLGIGQSQDIEVVYIQLPDLVVEKALQRYTYWGLRNNKPIYQYESLSSGFTAELPLDEHLMVLDYPELFTRILPH